MRPWQIFLLVATSLLVVALFVVNSLVGLTAAGIVDFSSVTDLHPAIRAEVDTGAVEQYILDYVAGSPGVNAPEWLVRALLPYGGAVWLAPDYDAKTIELRLLVREKRLGPVMEWVLRRTVPQSEIEEIGFSGAGFDLKRRGALTLDGWLPMEKNAAKDIWPFYKKDPAPALTPMEGGHLIEVRAENSNGAAYLVFVSLLHIFEIDLSEREEKISLTSFKFVEQLVFTVDIVQGDSLGFILRMDIEKGKKDKLAIVNMKIGLDELFAEFAKDLKRERGLVLVGQSEWHGDRLEFVYRLDDIPKLMQSLEADE